MQLDPGGRSRDTLFLPDFCEIRMVFSVVVVGELLAFVLALTPGGGARDRWSELALISVFVQWVGLTSAGLLCVCRRWLARFSNAVAGALALALILAVTGVLSEAAHWLARHRLGLAVPEGGEHLEFVLRNLAIGAIVGAVVLRYLYVQHQWKANLESEMRSRIQALQSRIRPHFLFNSMNTIASLTRSRPELAEEAVEDLADLFRVSLGDASIPVTLGRELEVCAQYLRIESLRLGARLRVEWRTEGLPEDALVPALSLQPLIENAIYHGVEPQPGGGMVRIEGERVGSSLRVLVINTRASDRAHGARAGNRMAQDNVRQRLHAFFGGRGALHVEPSPREYRVRVEFPYVRDPG